MHFFDISTSKSGPNVVCFVHFDFEMCFAPQRCTLFDTQLPKELRPWCVLYILTWKCASRHNNGVHFFNISTSKSGLRPSVFCTFDFEMCFAPQQRANFSSLIWRDGSAPAASLLFDPLEPQIVGKTSCFATLLRFRAPAPSFL